MIPCHINRRVTKCEIIWLFKLTFQRINNNFNKINQFTYGLTKILIINVFVHIHPGITFLMIYRT